MPETVKSSASNLDDNEKAFIEHMAAVADWQHRPKMEGRISGLLLLHNRPVSLLQMVRLLGVSKASVSMTARKLAQQSLIRRLPARGDRQDFYELHPNYYARAQDVANEHSRQLGRLHREASAMLRSLGNRHSIDLHRLSLSFDQHLDRK